jgi:hypothetical protein
MALQLDPPEGTATLPATAGIVPVPDPTTLTNQLVSRATQAIREVLETKIEDIDNRLNRLEPMLFERLVTTMETNNALYSQKLLAVHSEIDALRLLKAHDLASMQSHVDGETATIKHFYDEKFRSLDAQTSKAVIDVRIAMDAAFAAANAAAQKQENAFTKQIDQLVVSASQITKAFDDKIDDLKKIMDDKFGDLKDRIVAMESRSSVIDPTTVAALRDQAQTIAILKQSNDQGSGAYRQRADSNTWIFSAIAAAVAIGMMAIEMFRTAR